MNQYIITDEDICTIRDYILGAFYEGGNKERIYDLLKAEFSVIRSRPYNPQAEREKVLDDYVQWIIHGGQIFGYAYILDSVEKYKQELRQKVGE